MSTVMFVTEDLHKHCGNSYNHIQEKKLTLCCRYCM